jgi:type VI secretion system protein ImpL
MIFYIVTGVLLLAWLVLGWFLPGFAGLTGTESWIVRAIWWILGLGAAGAACYWKFTTDKKKKALAQAGELGAELEFVIAEAEKKLAANGSSLSKMPVIFAIGGRGAAKTTLITKSGLEPELLAGLVYQEGNQLVQTRSANVWLAKGTVFVEGAPTLLEDEKLWKAFAGSFAPRGMSALQGGGTAPRAVMLFVGTDEFYQANAGDMMTAKARVLNQRLIEMAKALGSRLPVYVMFTKADQMPHFASYVSYMGNDEVAQVFGATAALKDAAAAGVYAEASAAQFTGLIEELFRSLAERRVGLQERDANPQGRPPVYEFPREFRKLKQAAVSFLVDVGRPSQLAVSPFVRGFYFSGVRPVVMSDAAGTSRRVPQWVFITRFFHEVLLKDRNAMGAAAASTKTNTTRRLLLGAAAALGVIAGLLFTLSFFNNKALESELGTASKALKGVQVAQGEVPAADVLLKLDRLRESLVKLRGYEKDGAPLMMRWGLYTGDALLPTARQLYFQSFKNLLFGETQQSVLDYMRRLPSSPAPTDDYSVTYNALKAYLITTSNPDKSTKQFLSPVLMKYWQGLKQVDLQRQALVSKQFDFYAEELKESNPFSKENDALTIDRTRRFLTQFAGEERVYQFMLAEAGKKNPVINFNKTYPGSEKAVINAKDVPGAFSKDGHAWMMDAFKNLTKFFEGEAWVIGDQTQQKVNLTEVEARLRVRYAKDFGDQWKTYLKATRVLTYSSLKDAAEKLKMHAGNQSPVLGVIFLASKHTAVEDKTISEQFQPVQTVVPPAAALLLGGENQPYMAGLLQLQGAVEQISNLPASQVASDPGSQQAIGFAGAAKSAARTVAQKFRPDPVDKVDAITQKILEDPITAVEALLRVLGPAELNGAGAGFCKDFSSLISKYPFNPASKTQATIAEFNSVFLPQTGALWVFYESKLKAMLPNQGGEYRAVPGNGIALTPSFVAAFNRLASVTTTVYGLNPTPQFRYTVKLNAEPQRGVKLNVDGQSGEFVNAASPAKSFVWAGTGPGVRSTFVGGGTVSFDGPLGVFQWFNDAENWKQNTATGHTVLWYQRSGTKIMTDDQNKPLSMTLDLEMPIPLFRKGFLSGLQCEKNVASAK